MALISAHLNAGVILVVTVALGIINLPLLPPPEVPASTCSERTQRLSLTSVFLSTRLDVRKYSNDGDNNNSNQVGMGGDCYLHLTLFFIVASFFLSVKSSQVKSGNSLFLRRKMWVPHIKNKGVHM